jgi:hypothetical protein
MNIKRWIRNWLASPDKLSSATIIERDDSGRPEMTFSFVRAVNGTIIKVSKFKHNPNGPDWTHEMHIVREDETIQNAVLKVIAINALELQ